ncbi:MAG: thioredoxin-disulfide reductase [Lachnospiraceae bacterium]|nr:thioredoxin-disulfide reductase [Lachnospiraceae bacterium]
MYDLIIIGSGPAGLSAAVYGKRAGFDVVVIEMNPMSGGQVLNTYEVDNYLGMPGMNGFDMGMEFKKHAEGMGVEFVNARVSRIEKLENQYFNIITGDDSTDTSVTNDADSPSDKFKTKSIIVATGATHALLNVPGEEQHTGRGVSYCATCDGAFFRNKTVAVVGGGDVAAEDAVFLSRMCEKVYLIHRRDSLRAAKILQDRLFVCDNVEIIWDSVVEEIEGNEQVESIRLHNVKEDKHETKAVDGVFIAIGLNPNSGFVRDIVECDEGGYIIAGEDCVTKTPGVFAAGDVRTKGLRQIVTAVADGANAVASVERYLLDKPQK